MFAANHGAEIAWSSEMEDEGLNVVAVAGVTAEDEEDQIEQRYGA